MAAGSINVSGTYFFPSPRHKKKKNASLQVRVGVGSLSCLVIFYDAIF